MNKYKKIITEDNSITYYSNAYKEYYHTIKGAKSEALYKFIIPSDLNQRLINGKVRILDIAFGIGYNSLCSLDYKGEIEIISIEKDKTSCFLLLNEKNNISKKWYNILTSLKEKGYYNDKNQFIKLIFDDARNYMKIQNNIFDLIFLDPFSTKKNTELWTLDFFKLLYRAIDKNGLLITYSSALPVRSGLIKAGFYIGETDAFGRKRGGTIATKNKELIKNDISELDRYLITYSTAKIPYRDKKLQWSREEILNYREKLIKKLVSKSLLKTVKKAIREKNINTLYTKK